MVQILESFGTELVIDLELSLENDRRRDCLTSLLELISESAMAAGLYADDRDDPLLRPLSLLVGRDDADSVGEYSTLVFRGLAIRVQGLVLGGDAGLSPASGSALER